MAQRLGKRVSFESIPPHPDDQRALERMKFSRSDWDKLNWYVQFSAKPMDALSPGERLSLGEEVLALERTLIRKFLQADGRPMHSEDDIQRLHKFFREELTELADTGGITLGPFQTMISILFGRSSEWSGGEGHSLLPYYFAQLLKQFPESVRRCQSCKIIFLAPRKNAYHCSRECQSRTAAKKLRDRKKKQRSDSAVSRSRITSSTPTAKKREILPRKER